MTRWDCLPNHMENRISSEISTESKFRTKPNKTYLEKSEKMIQAEISDYLIGLRVKWKRKNVGVGTYIDKYGKERKVYFGTKGESDLEVLVPGYQISLEVKTVSAHLYIKRNIDKLLSGEMKMNKKNIHILEQIVYIEGVRTAGHIGEFVSSVDQVASILERAKK